MKKHDNRKEGRCAADDANDDDDGGDGAQDTAGGGVMQHLSHRRQTTHQIIGAPITAIKIRAS